MSKDQQLDFLKSVNAQLSMQSKALIAIKAQRDIDRNRRLMLLRRIKKEQILHKKNELALAVAVAASLILSIVSILFKL
jgi:hypothetical protein